MTRINTNLATLAATANLGKVQSRFAQATERLASGLRINRGQDDPAGLIASETLRRQAADLGAAIQNAQEADHFLAVAEGNLAEIADLLVDMQRLAVEAANTAGLSEAELHARQLELDNAVLTIERIANAASYADKSLLNGAEGYQTSGVGDALIPIDAVNISHALVPESGALRVDLEVRTQGQQAQQTWNVRRAFHEAPIGGSSTLVVTSDQGTQTFNFSGAAITTQDIVDVVNVAADTLGVSAVATGDQIEFVSRSYGTDAFVTVAADQPAGAYWADSADFMAAVDGQWTLRVAGSSGTRLVNFWGPQASNDVLTAVNAVSGNTGVRAIYQNNEFSFLSTTAGPTASVNVQVLDYTYYNDSDAPDLYTANGGVGTPATYDWSTYADFLAAAVTDTSTLYVRGNLGAQNLTFATGAYTANDIVNAVNGVAGATGVTAAFAAGTITFTSVDADPSAFIQLRGLERPAISWADPSEFLTHAALVTNSIRVTGDDGSTTLNFSAAPFTAQDVVDAVNAAVGSTGVQASQTAGAITFYANELGPNELVNVRAWHAIPSLTSPIDHSEAAGTGFNQSAYGGDSAIEVRTINFDPRTRSSGLIASLDSLELDIDLRLGNFIGTSVGGKGAEGIYSVNTEFYITGGGSNFNLSPDVSVHGRLSAGLPSVLPTNLGDYSVGFLHDVMSGGNYSLVGGGAEQASDIIDAAIVQIANLRGELGMLQRHIVEPAINNHRISLENTRAAESVVRDAEFALEFSELTRAQLLTQGVGQALRVAQAQPRSILQLLQ